MSCGVGRLLGEYDVGKGSWRCENVVADAGELATSCVSTWLVSFYRFWPTGSDTNNGTSSSTPWQTITKVNGATFQPGDGIANLSRNSAAPGGDSPGG